MSAYSASPPVTTRKMDPSARNAFPGSFTKRSIPYPGHTALSTPGWSTICASPRMAMTRNHTIITGPNTREIRSVPRRWTRNRTTRIATETGTTHDSKALVATSNPSTALSTEMAGVISPSP